MSMIGSVDGVSPVIHPEAWVAPGAVVVGQVTLGRGTSVWYGSVLRGDAGEIIVGAGCNLQALCCLPPDEGALVGIGAIVLGRARIGPGALVAAGTVVLPGTLVPGGVLYARVPGRVVRELTDRDRATFAETPAHYGDWAERRRRAKWHDGTAG